MVGSKKAVALAAALAMLVTPLAGATAQTRPYHRHYGYGHTYRPIPTRYWNSGPRYGYGYGSGWRHRSNARGWDNTCLDTPWLPSEFACSAR